MEPEEMTLIGVALSAPKRSTAPFPNCFSMATSARSIARRFSASVIDFEVGFGGRISQMKYS